MCEVVAPAECRMPHRWAGLPAGRPRFLRQHRPNMQACGSYLGRRDGPAMCAVCGVLGSVWVASARGFTAGRPAAGLLCRHRRPNQAQGIYRPQPAEEAERPGKRQR
jgi:hypothetical protein